MKKLLIGISAVLLAGIVAAPAQADLDVLANVSLTKDVFINEDIIKVKNLTITVIGEPESAGAAEALVFANVTNTGNNVGPVEQQDGPDLLQFDAFIGPGEENGGSINGNHGIVGVNQDVGNNVNQANLVAAAVSDSEGAAANSEAVVDQVNTGNTTTFTGQFPGENGVTPEKNTTILDSIQDNTGIVGVNQNAGDNNNQTNAVAVALGDDGDSIFALSNAFLGQVNMNNTVTETNTARTPTITNSITGNSGITTVNQTPGNMVNQGTVISLSGRVSIF